MKRLKAFGRLFAAALSDSLRLFALAPLIPLAVVAVEFAQHVAEVRLGMFADAGAFNRQSLDPDRLQWGYVKVATMSVAVFLASRVWVNRREGKPWWSLASIAWRPFLIGFVLTTLLSVPLLPGVAMPPALVAPLTLLVYLVTLPLLVLMMAGILGDSTASVAGVYRSGWGIGLRILLLMAIGFVPMQLLHLWNHLLAIDAHPLVLWLLLIWDSLLVGLMANYLGTASHHGYVGHGGTAGRFTRT
jgi:hypothetical protein